MLDPEHWNPDEPETIDCQFGEIFLTIDEDDRKIFINFKPFEGDNCDDKFIEGALILSMDEFEEETDEDDIDIFTYIQIQIQGVLALSSINDLNADQLQTMLIEVLDKAGFIVLTTGFEDTDEYDIEIEVEPIFTESPVAGMDTFQSDPRFAREG